MKNEYTLETLSENITKANDMINEVQGLLNVTFSPIEVKRLMTEGMNFVIEKMREEDNYLEGQDLEYLNNRLDGMIRRCAMIGIEVSRKGKLRPPSDFWNRLNGLLNI